MSSSESWVLVAAGLGVLAGLALVARGLTGYRTALRVADTSTSTVSSAAAGELRISGVIEPAELTLVSPLQSVQCVYYRAAVGQGGDASFPDRPFTEERWVGFKVRDSTGSLRVFPRGARVDAPLRFHEETGLAGDPPPGLLLRTGPATRTAELDTAAAIAELLTVHDPSATGETGIWHNPQGRPARLDYRESRLEPGDAVTIVGRALPFRDLDDPTAADLGMGGDDPATDPEIAADLAAARAAGTLVDDPDAAWGNAAIPGFGIGRPVSRVSIDPAANPLQLAAPDAAAVAQRRFEIPPDALVIAASPEVPLLIAYGTPNAVVARDETRFAIGLVGAGLAIVSAVVLAWAVGGGIGA